MNPIKHVAIIMDGNGRWGISKRKSRNFGHKQGLKSVEKIIKESLKKKIKYLTLYAFSTENWRRPKKEINYLFSLLHDFLSSKIKELNNENIQFFVIGKKKFNKNLNNLLNYSEKLTFNNKRLQINLALNYGSKSELIGAFKKINKSRVTINEKNIDSNLQTKNITEPDLLIRTGNTKRLSNFLLWQLAYAEIFFEKKLWPAFNEKDFNRIIMEYKKIKRNFGKI